MTSNISIPSGAPSNNGASNESSSIAKSKKGMTCNRYGIYAASTVIIGLIVAVAVYFATRPGVIEVQMIDESSTESVRTVIKAANIEALTGENGLVTLEYSTLLSDPSTTKYYLDIQGDMETLEDFHLIKQSTDNPVENGATSVVLHLTRNSNPTAETLGEDDIKVLDPVFPHPILEDDFLPGDYKGLLIALLDKDEDVLEPIASLTFDLIVNPEQNIATPTAPTEANQSKDVESSTMQSPTASPQTEDKEVSTSLPILESNLESARYNIAGSITVDYRNDLVNGQIETIPILKFDLAGVPRVPLPFLYLSKRPYSETRGGDLDPDDIFIPIDGAEQGSCTLLGAFEQSFDEIDTGTMDLSEYVNGSWIVWCEPFRVYLGGGPIIEA